MRESSEEAHLYNLEGKIKGKENEVGQIDMDEACD